MAEEDPAPSGSQRALARLRRATDGVAAQRRGYVRLGTAIPPLGVPEGAVVAAFERVDLVEADPVAEIVVGGVDPDRSLADHAFARRLHRRSDTFVSIGPGPLVVAPDLASGVPSDPATRSGRALALQLLGVALARADRIATDRIVVGAYPAWLADEPSAVARILAEVDIRRSLFPDQLIRFDEPSADGHPRPAAAWPYVGRGSPGPSGFVRPADAQQPCRQGRSGCGRSSRGPDCRRRGRGVEPAGAARGHPPTTPSAMLAAAMTTLERLSDLGWRAVVGDPPRSPGRGREGSAVGHRRRRRGGTDGVVRPARAIRRGMNAPVRLAARHRGDHVDRRGVTDGCRQIGRPAVDEDIDVGSKPRALLDETVAHAGCRCIERRDERVDRAAPKGRACARHPGTASAAISGAGPLPRRTTRRPYDPRTTASTAQISGRLPVTSRHESPSSELCHS